jgi:8-oxo-dGTP diphosphatase
MTDNNSTTKNPVGRFMVAVGAIIENDSGQIAILRRSKNLDWNPNEWEIPYGRLAQFEDPMAGLMREVKEEIGLDLVVEKPIRVWHLYRGEEETAHNELVGITFACHAKTTNISISDEHEEFRWVTPQEAIDLMKVDGIAEDVRAFIQSKNR